MKLLFDKMQGLGNDFVVLDGITQTIALTPTMIRKIADRHYGIGCDQVLLLESSTVADCDFSYRIFNADGKEVEQCGNGARCVGRFLLAKGLTDKSTMTLATMGGKISVTVNQDNSVTVDMGKPEFAPSAIPFKAITEQAPYPLEVADTSVQVYVVNIGNPHAVLLVDDIDQAPVGSLGAAIESHSRFPERVNVGFMQIINQNHLGLRVFERGVGETLACGTGAIAAAVIAIRYQGLLSPVTVDLPGGQLTIEWRGEGETIKMKGPAEFVFHGEWLR